MAAGLFLDPTGWTADGVYDPSKRGIWQIHDVCVYRDPLDREAAPLGLEDVRDMIDSEAVDTAQLRLFGTLRPLGWRPGDPVTGPCNACVSMLGAAASPRPHSNRNPQRSGRRGHRRVPRRR